LTLDVATRAKKRGFGDYLKRLLHRVLLEENESAIQLRTAASAACVQLKGEKLGFRRNDGGCLDIDLEGFGLSTTVARVEEGGKALQGNRLEVLLRKGVVGGSIRLARQMRLESLVNASKNPREERTQNQNSPGTGFQVDGSCFDRALSAISGKKQKGVTNVDQSFPEDRNIL